MDSEGLKPEDLGGAPAARSPSTAQPDRNDGLASPPELPSRGSAWARALLDSRLTRRMLLLSVLCATLPLVALAILWPSELRDELRRDRDAQLAGSALAYGVALLDRLSAAEALLVDGAGEAVPQGISQHRLAARVGHEFSGLAVLDGAGRSLTSVGEFPGSAPIDLKEATNTDAAARLALAGTEEPTVVLVVPSTTAEAGRGRWLAASMRPTYLWGDIARVPPLTDVCVVASGDAVLHCSRPVRSSILAKAVSNSLMPATGQPESDDDETRTGIRRLPLARLGSDEWVVVAAQPDALAVRATASLAGVLVPVAAAALLIGVLVGLAQASRTVAPLRALIAATKTLEESGFSASLRVGGSDEWATLGRTFNAMADRMRLRFGTLKTLSRIDRVVLTSLDMHEVAHHALAGVLRNTPVETACLGLLEPDAPHTMRLYTLKRKGQAALSRSDLAWSPADSERLSAASSARWSETPPLPDGFANQAWPNEKVRRAFWTVPAAQGRRARGVLVLADHTRPEISADQAAAIDAMLDRVAIAVERAEQDVQKHRKAHIDALTGLPTRGLMHEILAKELVRARREGRRVAVLFLDLDRFKQINDTLGHAAGDSLLTNAALRIRETVREGDSVARFAGDEFTVVLPDLDDARDAGNVAKHLIEALAKPYEIDGQQLYVGASVGIAVYPQDGRSASELVHNADAAMYRAKKSGSNRFAFFEERMNAEIKKRATLDRELRLALERNEFELHYQPQLDLRSGRITGAEALLRWRHPQRGLLSPAEFIDVAEESELIEPIGRWVIREACGQHRLWKRAGLPVSRVSVNVSNRQLRRTDFLRTVDYILVTTKLQPEALEIEITESLFLEGGQMALNALRALEEAGVRVAIDDFGTGYSTLSYLRTLPASILKVDKSFIDEVAEQEDAGTIAQAIINMAHTLGKEVVAEGVETYAQMQFLKGLQCERIQGFLLSRALPPAEFSSFMTQFDIGQLAIATIDRQQSTRA